VQPTSRSQILLADYIFCSNASFQLTSTTKCIDRFASRLDRLVNNHKKIAIQHHYVLALLWSGRYYDAQRAQIVLSSLALDLGDCRSSAYELTSEIHLSTIVMPYSTAKFEALSREAIVAASEANDVYLEIIIRNFVGWEEFHRGRITKASEAADELMAVGRRMND
jgi:hypothetical protein